MTCEIDVKKKKKKKKISFSSTFFFFSLYSYFRWTSLIYHCQVKMFINVLKTYANLRL